jgi:hypothetical protein
MSLTKQNETLVFDQVLNTTSGAITGAIMRPISYPTLNVGVDQTIPGDIPEVQEDVHVDVQQVVQEEGQIQADAPDIPIPPAIEIPAIRRDINDLHNLLGHAHFDAIKKSAKYYSIKLTGEQKTCVSCALAKICQKNLNKVTLSKSLKPGDQIYVNISGTIWRSYGGAKYWILIVDDQSQCCWSNFVPDKASPS